MQRAEVIAIVILTIFLITATFHSYDALSSVEEQVRAIEKNYQQRQDLLDGIANQVKKLEAETVIVQFAQIRLSPDLQSQAGQDKYMLLNFFMHRNGRPGIFVEFGARDGIEHSNTFYLERALDWKGVLLEPGPEFESLGRNRNDSICLKGVICAKPGFVKFATMGIPGWHGIGDFIKESREDFVESEETFPCHTLQSLFDFLELTHINYMTIDTEGSEADILSTFPFTSYVVDFFQVEDLDYRNRKRIDEIMKKAGYTPVTDYVVADDTIDCIYERNNAAANDYLRQRIKQQQQQQRISIS